MDRKQIMPQLQAKCRLYMSRLFAAALLLAILLMTGCQGFYSGQLEGRRAPDREDMKALESGESPAMPEPAGSTPQNARTGGSEPANDTGSSETLPDAPEQPPVSSTAASSAPSAETQTLQGDFSSSQPSPAPSGGTANPGALVSEESGSEEASEHPSPSEINAASTLLTTPESSIFYSDGTSPQESADSSQTVLENSSAAAGEQGAEPGATFPSGESLPSESLEIGDKDLLIIPGLSVLNAELPQEGSLILWLKHVDLPVLLAYYNASSGEAIAEALLDISVNYAGRLIVASVDLDVLGAPVLSSLSSAPAFFIYRDGVQRQSLSGYSSSDDLARLIHSALAD